MLEFPNCQSHIDTSSRVQVLEMAVLYCKYNSSSCSDQLMFTPDNASLEPDPAKVDLKTILVWGGTGGFGRVQGGRWVVT